MAWQGKVLAAKADNMSLVSRTHKVEEELTPAFSSDLHIHTVACSDTYMHIIHTYHTYREVLFASMHW